MSYYSQNLSYSTGTSSVCYSSATNVRTSVSTITRSQMSAMSNDAIKKFQSCLSRSGKSSSEVFQQFDPNNTGRVREFDFYRLIDSLDTTKTQISLLEIVSLTKLADKDRNGFIDYKEFTNLIEAVSSDSTPGEPEKERQSATPGGPVPIERPVESAPIMYSTHTPGYHVEQAAPLVYSTHTPMPQVEVTPLVYSTYAPAPPMDPAIQVFLESDFDRDGVLNIEEFTTALFKVGFQLTVAERDHLFNVANRNQAKGVDIDAFKRFLAGISTGY